MVKQTPRANWAQPYTHPSYAPQKPQLTESFSRDAHCEGLRRWTQTTFRIAQSSNNKTTIIANLLQISASTNQLVRLMNQQTKVDVG
ncbi:hypothetical protein TNCV_4218021 [Trichonephila clavipes]|nr:hypothetical protein TNCV_4218021 [Trichonephila clavipes]